MKFTLPLVLLTALALASGCTASKKTTNEAPASSVLNIPATPPAPAMAYTPAPAPQPVYDAPQEAQDQPIMGEALADASDSISAPPPRAVRKAPTGTRYKVKKGESLWTIAKSHYGSGNKWKAIANANPNINPDRIQAGQTIILP